MKTDIFLLGVIVGTISLFISSGYGLKCYDIRVSNVTGASNDTSTWPVKECRESETKCVLYEYNVHTRNSNGNHVYLGTGSLRRCVSDPLDDYCTFVISASDRLVSATTHGRIKMYLKNCDLCDTDLCNAVTIKE